MEKPIPASLTTPRKRLAELVRQRLLDRPVYLDTETTGLERDDEIVEISIVDDDCQVLFHALVKPSRPIPPAVTRLHGISNAMVQSERSWPIVWQMARPFLLGKTVVIYNAEYDLRLMQQSHARYKLPWRENLNTICAMKLYAEYRGDWDPRRRAYRYIRLEDAGKQCSIDLPNAHRATADALLTQALFHYMAEHD